MKSFQEWHNPNSLSQAHKHSSQTQTQKLCPKLDIHTIIAKTQLLAWNHSRHDKSPKVYPMHEVIPRMTKPWKSIQGMKSLQARQKPRTKSQARSHSRHDKTLKVYPGHVVFPAWQKPKRLLQACRKLKSLSQAWRHSRHDKTLEVYARHEVIPDMTKP